MLLNTGLNEAEIYGERTEANHETDRRGKRLKGVQANAQITQHRSVLCTPVISPLSQFDASISGNGLTGRPDRDYDSRSFSTPNSFTEID